MADLEAEAPACGLMSRSKVMMVDDEPINMRVLQLHLKAEGYDNFVTVSDSKTAFDVICAENPDVLLLDLNMPEVSGFEIMQQIRSDEKHKQLPVIVLTSSNDPDNKLRALQLGATDFLSKPVDASGLALRMKNTLVARAYERRLMHVDSLTDLPNRLCFSVQVKRFLETSVTNGISQALVLVNLSRFKSINDTFGPDRGDDLLWAFSQRLRSVVEQIEHRDSASNTEISVETNFMARLGGDRFGICVPLSSPAERDASLHEFLEAIAGTVELPFMLDSQKVFLSLEMGVSTLDHETAGVETLINEAETAMNHVKHRPSSCYSFFSSDMLSEARRRLKIENLLRTCIDNSELFLLYQPKVCCKTNTISSAEALVRWEHSELGLVSPVDFIPVAESTGMIVNIGRWVLLTACVQTKKFRDQGYPELKIAVNVSIRQLYETDFLQSVRSALHLSRLPPEALMIELTENMIMENVEETICKLANLRSIGVRISVDDFGTGYSSLSYLQRFPIDQLKIDRSFITQIDSEQCRAPIVRAIVSLAHDLDLSVVAEGVEAPVQKDYVTALGCEEYQGFLKSPPVSSSEFIDLLHDDMRKCA